MKTKFLIIALLVLSFTASITLNFYFYTRLIFLENETKGWYMNNNSFIVDSWTGKGKRLVNEDGKRSRTFPAILFNDSFANNDSLVRFKDKNGKMGYLNSSSMDVEIQASFHFLTEFSDQLALAILNSSDSCYGFINRDGKFIINPNLLLQKKYVFSDSIDSTPPRFLNGFCIIPARDGFFLINRSGKQASSIYDKIKIFSSKNHIFVCYNNNKWGAILFQDTKEFPIKYIDFKYNNYIDVFKQCILLEKKVDTE